ncbi:hypothetical protein M2169_005136 [Streptomyces sp. MJP52]|nr:hypothetical protein [Streptomyces sp. MJP52]
MAAPETPGHTRRACDNQQLSPNLTASIVTG